MIGTKTPDETKDYTLDWTSDLGTDTVNTSTFSVSPQGVIVASSFIVTGNLQTTVFLSSGAVGQNYEIKNTIVTTGGRTLTKVFYLLVEASNNL